MCSNSFPNEVIKELKNYVYKLIDPRNGQVFYIGRGKGNRVFEHIYEESNSTNDNYLSEKIKTIREIKAAGLQVIHVIHRHGMEDEMAEEVEAALIDDHPELTNLMGGSGSNDYGPMNAKEIVNKYAAETAEFKHKCLMITINKTFADRENYSATRFAWKLSKDKAEKVDYVLSVIQGIIVEVYKPTKWLEATKENFKDLHEDAKDRFGFEGERAESDIRRQYIGKKIPDEFRKRGAANPVRYSFK